MDFNNIEKAVLGVIKNDKRFNDVLDEFQSFGLSLNDEEILLDIDEETLEVNTQYIFKYKPTKKFYIINNIKHTTFEIDSKNHIELNDTLFEDLADENNRIKKLLKDLADEDLTDEKKVEEKEAKIDDNEREGKKREITLQDAINERIDEIYNDFGRINKLIQKLVDEHFQDYKKIQGVEIRKRMDKFIKGYKTSRLKNFVRRVIVDTVLSRRRELVKKVSIEYPVKIFEAVNGNGKSYADIIKLFKERKSLMLELDSVKSLWRDLEMHIDDLIDITYSEIIEENYLLYTEMNKKTNMYSNEEDLLEEAGNVDKRKLLFDTWSKTKPFFNKSSLKQSDFIF